MQFEEEARRDQILLRGFFMGATGSGKSRGALELAAHLSDYFGSVPITLINTEPGRGKLYADRYKFAYIGLEGEESLGPENWIRAFDLAEQRNPGGIVIADSASHEWMGRDGILSRADRFGDWKRVRPQHNDFVERIAAVKGHVIVCCRAKMKYEVSERDVPGRTKPQQTVTPLGLGPVQADDLQYEFNLVGRFDVTTHEVSFSGHVDPLVDTVHNLLEDGVQVAETLGRWLAEGDPIEAPAAANPSDIAQLRASLDAEGFTAEQIERGFAVARRQNRGQLSPEYVQTKIAESTARLEAKKPKEEPAADAEKAAGDAQDAGERPGADGAAGESDEPAPSRQRRQAASTA